MIFVKITQNFVKSPLKICLISQISVHSLWHACSFVICSLDRIIPLVAILKNSKLQLASVAEQASLCHTWSQTFEDRFTAGTTI